MGNSRTQRWDSSSAKSSVTQNESLHFRFLTFEADVRFFTTLEILKITVYVDVF